MPRNVFFKNSLSTSFRTGYWSECYVNLVSKVQTLENEVALTAGQTELNYLMPSKLGRAISKNTLKCSISFRCCSKLVESQRRRAAHVIALVITWVCGVILDPSLLFSPEAVLHFSTPVLFFLARSRNQWLWIESRIPLD